MRQISNSIHYENLPMQYTVIFEVVKNENFQQIFFYIFLIFAENLDVGNPQSIFLEQK